MFSSMVPGCRTRPGDADRLKGFARDAVAFLDGRQEFWRQQRPTAPSSKSTKRAVSSKSGESRRAVSAALSGSTRRTPG